MPPQNLTVVSLPSYEWCNQLNLKGVHFLSARVWGGPNARGTFTLRQIRSLLQEARDLGTVKYISLEGGEPFLYYPIMTQTAKDAASMGFRVEILSNCYWAIATGRLT